MTTSGRRSKLAAILLAATLITPAAFAEEFTWFGHEKQGNWLLGLKGASLQNGRPGHDDASNSAVLLGYRFAPMGRLPGSASLEFEFSNSFDEGDVINGGHFGVPGQWSSDTVGLYYTYRSPGTVYFLGKFGALKTDITTSVANSGELSEQDTSFSYGGGIGLHLGQSGNFNVELEFVGSSGESEINMINLGGIYRFD
jgi:hypothetical protein